MKVTKVARTSPRDAAKGSTNAPASVKIKHTAKDETGTVPATTQRGPKVLQSHQARQRCLEFSRG
jgi:hypothetical protein